MMSLGMRHTPRRRTDEYFSNTVLLFSGDKENGSTDIADQSYAANGAMTLFGDCAYSDAQAKIGSSSIFLGGGAFADGGFRYVVKTASEFGNTAVPTFTFEAWINPTELVQSGGTHPTIISTSRNHRLLVRSDTQKLAVWNGGIALSGNTTINTNEWTHVAWVRSGASPTHRMFVNGVLQTVTYANSNNVATQSNTVWIGSAQSDTAGLLSGWIEGIRVTQGVARYTSNFTPPIESLPVR